MANKKLKVDYSKDQKHLSNTPGECPYCKSNMINYEGPDVQDDMIYYECTCEDCDNSFKEWYFTTFDGIWGYPLETKKKIKKGKKNA